MARKPRIHYPGACYHVILRGNGGREIFYDRQDRIKFFFLLQEGVEKYHHHIHAYCQMTNHVHLAIQVGDIPLSRIMQNLSFRYTLHINRRKKQTGHLFQGRYKALLIDADHYLLELVRYIHNNPVRADLVKSPDKYPWSSHMVYLGETDVPWMTTDWVLSQFSSNKNRAIRLYKEFVHAGREEEHRQEFHRGTIEGRILGDDCFGEEALTKASQQISPKMTIEHVLKKVCRYYKIKPDDLSGRGKQRSLSEPRTIAAYIVRETDHLRLTELGRKIKRDLSGLSQAASRLDKRMRDDNALSCRVKEIQESLR